MDSEFHFWGRIFLPQGPLALTPLKVGEYSKISKTELREICVKISAALEVKVVACLGREDYGVANVFNGGSDYEVIAEEWFLLECENGNILCEKTFDHFDAEIELRKKGEGF